MTVAVASLTAGRPGGGSVPTLVAVGVTPSGVAVAAGVTDDITGGQFMHLGNIMPAPLDAGVAIAVAVGSVFAPGAAGDVGVVVGVANPPSGSGLGVTRQRSAGSQAAEVQMVLACALPTLVCTNAAPSVPPRISTRAVVHTVREHRFMIGLAGGCFIAHCHSFPKK